MYLSVHSFCLTAFVVCTALLRAAFLQDVFDLVPYYLVQLRQSCWFSVFREDTILHIFHCPQ